MADGGTTEIITAGFKQQSSHRPFSREQAPLYRCYDETSSTWIVCGPERGGQPGVRMWSRFHHRLIESPTSKISSGAAAAVLGRHTSMADAFAADKAMSITEGKSSSLSIISEVAAFENYMLL